MTQLEHPPEKRFDAEAGIAIGPILFIIAILAILAAAIAAGSGNFTAGTTNESNRTKSAALIQIGENLKTGMDRLVMENEVAFSAVDTNVANTSGNNELFSPTGGGITPPSYSLANNPSNDGTAAHGEQYLVFPARRNSWASGYTTASELIAVLAVSQGVCDEVNSKANSMPTPAGADLGYDFSTATSQRFLSDQWLARRAKRAYGRLRDQYEWQRYGLLLLRSSGDPISRLNANPLASAPRPPA